MAANEHGPGWDESTLPPAPEGAPEAAPLYAAEVAAGEMPSIRRIRRDMHVGQDRAQSVQAYLAALTRT